MFVVLLGRDEESFFVGAFFLVLEVGSMVGTVFGPSNGSEFT